MAHKYLSVLFISDPLIASNNRGESNGNVQSLQKISTAGGTRTILSGYSLRYAMRSALQDQGLRLWRRSRNPTPDNPVGFVYGDNDSPTMDEAVPPTPEGYMDAGFGWMVAPKGKAADSHKSVSAIAVSMAVSTTPFDNGTAFAQGHKAKGKGKPPRPELAPFQFEQHWTRYQFLMTLNLSELDPKIIRPLLRTLKGLQVGGAHASRMNELTPAALIWRFHQVRGQSGLYMGSSMDFAPDGEINLAPLYARAENLGFDFKVGGQGFDFSINDALGLIADEAEK